MTADYVVNVCPDFVGSSGCSIDTSSFVSGFEENDNYKNERCVDRYDSSESSDSGVLTGSTCSESSSNGGNIDIIDPRSPYGVTSFNLGNFIGFSSTSSSRSIAFASKSRLTTKMLPENLSSEKENNVSCWMCDKSIKWNDRYELTQDGIDLKGKRANFFQVIGRQNCDPNDSRCSLPGHANGTILVDKLSFSIPSLKLNLIEGKNLNSVDSWFDMNELSISVTKNFLNRPPCKESPKTPENYVSKEFLHTNKRKAFLYHSILQSKRVRAVANGIQLPVLYDEKRTDYKKCHFAAPKTTAISRFFVNRSYPLDFFNILPSIFKSPILPSIDCYWESKEGDSDSLVDTATLHSEVNFFHHSKMKMPHKVDDVHKTITVNNKSDCKSCDNDDVNDANGKQACCSNSSDDCRFHRYQRYCYCHHPYPFHLNYHFQYRRRNQNQKVTGDDEDDTSEQNEHCNSENNLFSFSERAATHFGVNKTTAGTRKHPFQAATDAVTVDKEIIRFPTNRKLSFLAERICCWSDCVDHISSSAKLIEHLQTKHVNSQAFSETFICLWSGCKVFGRRSCSRTWLERHVLSHGGNKPYKCIVDNCGHRFSSQTILERHINQHFKNSKEYTDGVVDTAPKLKRKNGQKSRYRRQPYSVRSRADVFDVGIMSKLQFLLVQMAHRSQKVSLNVLDSKHFLHVVFQPKVIGSRREMNGNIKYLVRWYPYNALEDEWLPKSKIEGAKNIPIWKLPASVQQLFWDSIFPKRCSVGRKPRKYGTDLAGAQ